MPNLKQESILLLKVFSRNLKRELKHRKHLTSTLFEDDSIELNFTDGYGISVRDQSLLDVLGIEEMPDPNRGSLLEATKKWLQCNS